MLFVSHLRISILWRWHERLLSFIESFTSPASSNLSYLLDRIVQASDKSAFNAFYNQTIEELYRYCLTLTKDHNLTLDILQTTYAKLWKNHKNLTRIDSPVAYLKTTAKNILYDYYRKPENKQRFVSVEIATNIIDTADGRFEHLENHVLLEKIEMALDCLTAEQREVFLAVKLYRQSKATIANRLNVSPNRVRWILETAVNKLRGMFADV